ncbi:MAG: hypothetical protein HKL85_13635 [Acidimicrobiaceae bacterium]|nr:hypothetical protein [Acidimicrobiaceae bacterium]
MSELIAHFPTQVRHPDVPENEGPSEERSELVLGQLRLHPSAERELDVRVPTRLIEKRAEDRSTKKGREVLPFEGGSEFNVKPYDRRSIRQGPMMMSPGERLEYLLGSLNERRIPGTL